MSSEIFLVFRLLILEVVSTSATYLKSFLQVCDDQREIAPRSNQRGVDAHVILVQARLRIYHRALTRLEQNSPKMTELNFTQLVEN